MTEVFKMKFILVWITLIPETFLLPTYSPNVDDTKACCSQNPKLIYQGHDSSRGINVYVFEFLPENKEYKDRVEDTTMKYDFQTIRNAPKSTQNGENYEDTIIPTINPASIYDKKQTPDTETGTRGNTHMLGLILSTVGAPQNDIEMYENTSLLTNATHGLQTGTSNISEVQKTSGHSNRDDYYATESTAVFDIPSKRNTPKTRENEENYKDTINLTNKSTSIYGKNDFSDTENGTRHNSSTPNVKSDTITSTVSVPQNDFAMYEDRDLLVNVTEGLKTGMLHTKKVRKTSGHSNGDDYYGTEGSALLDIPVYNDTDMGNQGTNADFLPNINDSRSNIGCSESDLQCKYSSKPKEDIFVTQPPTQKDLFYSKINMDRPDRHTKEEEEKNTMNRKVKSSMKPTKTNKRKGEKQTKEIFQYNSRKRLKSGGKRHNYRHSSSESRSDSSQEFD